MLFPPAQPHGGVVPLPTDQPQRERVRPGQEAQGGTHSVGHQRLGTCKGPGQDSPTTV
eukprot:gene20572-biopygen14639